MAESIADSLWALSALVHATPRGLSSLESAPPELPKESVLLHDAPSYEPRRPDFIDVECGLTIGTRAAATGFTGD
jgi:hypothetical protein